MIRVRRLHAKQDPATTRALPVIVAGVGLAAVLRIGGFGAPAALGLAVACWSLAMLLLLIALLRTEPLFSYLIYFYKITNRRMNQ